MRTKAWLWAVGFLICACSSGSGGSGAGGSGAGGYGNTGNVGGNNSTSCQAACANVLSLCGMPLPDCDQTCAATWPNDFRNCVGAAPTCNDINSCSQGGGSGGSGNTAGSAGSAGSAGAGSGGGIACVAAGGDCTKAENCAAVSCTCTGSSTSSTIRECVQNKCLTSVEAAQQCATACANQGFNAVSDASVPCSN
ncbi:MAG: hypothetical protein R3B13_39315 [Polyangiaceae bacterium]